jgi:hypothetical protein
MEAVIAVVALLFMLFLVVAGYATVKVVGAAKRGVDRTITQARRTVEDTSLRAKTLVQPGAVGELAQLRLHLRTSMRATQDALHAAVAEDASLKESLGLFERLSVHGHELDDELKRLESEPDRACLAERLPALRERTERITKSADALRWAARDRARRFADDDLDSLSAQIDVEAGALRHWTEPGQPRRAGSSPGPASRTAASWPQDAGPQDAEPEGAAAEQNRPRSSAVADQAPPRPAITPQGPRVTYSWQKNARPENTT